MIGRVRAAALVFFSLAAAELARAQDGATVLKTQSLWAIFYQGLEWPAFFILAGSVALFAIITEHFLTIRAAAILPAEQLKSVKSQIERRQYQECLEATRKSNTFFARVMAAALGHARHGFDAMHEAAMEKSSQLSGQMFRKVEYMNLLGNLGPLLGLLGTVYGMILAFGELGQGGGEASTNAGNLARGISLALVNTLLGLMLAVVGLGFFGVCRNRVDGMTVAATVQALDLLEYFRPAAQAAASPPSAAAPRPSGGVRPSAIASAGLPPIPTGLPPKATSHAPAAAPAPAAAQGPPHGSAPAAGGSTPN